MRKIGVLKRSARLPRIRETRWRWILPSAAVVLGKQIPMPGTAGLAYEGLMASHATTQCRASAVTQQGSSGTNAMP